MPGLDAFLLIAIIGIPVFFIWRWILSKLMPAGRKRKIALYIATIVTAPVAYMCAIALFFFYLLSYPTHPFDKNAWASNKGKRYEYTADLIKRQLLIDKSKTEVIKLLGIEGNQLTSNLWIYEVGFVPSLGVDIDILEITFKNEKVVDVKQRGT